MKDISIKEACAIKSCSRTHIDNHKKELNWKGTRIWVDAKFNRFEKKKAGRKPNETCK